MTDNASPPVTLKARKAPRLTYKQEIQTIKNLPRTQRLIVVMKIAGVFLVAIGLEGIVTGQYLFTFVFIPLGVFISMLPIRIKTGCASHADRPWNRTRRSARNAARRKCDVSGLDQRPGDRRRVDRQFQRAEERHPSHEVFLLFPEMSEPGRERGSGCLGRDRAHALREVVHLRSILRGGEERERRHGPRGTKGRVDAGLRGALIPERPSLRDEVPEGPCG